MSSKRLWINRKERLFKLKHLADDIGDLLPLTAREDQEELDLLFQKLNKRIHLLYQYLQKRNPLNSTAPIKNNSELPDLSFNNGTPFQSNLERAKLSFQEWQRTERLRRTQLLYAGVPPSLKFSYLSEIKFEGEEIYLLYSSSSGKPCEIFTLKYWEKVIHSH